MAFKLSQKSLSKLHGVNPMLNRVVHDAIIKNDCRFWRYRRTKIFRASKTIIKTKKISNIKKQTSYRTRC